MTILKHFPAPPLGEVVELFWHSADDNRAARAANREAILPDGCAHLVINLSQNRIGLYKQIESNRLTTLGGSIFCGPRSSAYAIRPAAERLGLPEAAMRKGLSRTKEGRRNHHRDRRKSKSSSRTGRSAPSNT